MFPNHSETVTKLNMYQSIAVTLEKCSEYQIQPRQIYGNIL